MRSSPFDSELSASGLQQQVVVFQVLVLGQRRLEHADGGKHGIGSVIGVIAWDGGCSAQLPQLLGGCIDADTVIKNAAGVLAFSGIVKGAFIFGAEGGNGALQVKGKSVAYYNFAAASFGLQAGGQSKALVVIFRDQAALDGFRKSSGFELGVDGQVAFFNKGSGDTLTTITKNNPIVFYVFDNTGLLADVSMKGGKFTKLDR